MKSDNIFCKKPIWVYIFFFTLLIVGCSGAKYPYDEPVKMIFDKNIRESNKLLSEVPSGWFVAEDESVPNNISILLLENKYRAAIILSEIKIARNAREILQKKGFEDLAALSFEMKNENARDSLSLCGKSAIYEIDDKNFAAYDYKKADSDDTVRVLVFKTPDAYYELSSLHLRKQNQQGPIPRDTLLSIQYNVLKKIIENKVIK